MLDNSTILQVLFVYAILTFKENKHIISLPNLYMSLLVKTQDATAEYFFCTSKC